MFGVHTLHIQHRDPSGEHCIDRRKTNTLNTTVVP